jgi:multidrug efflux pump
MIASRVGFDSTQFVRASIREVRETILVAVGLVVWIIFLFLRTWRSTLVPAVVIPISLHGPSSSCSWRGSASTC